MFFHTGFVDELEAIYWVEIGERSSINLAELRSAEWKQKDQPSTVTLTYHQGLVKSFEGESADLIIERLKNIGNPVFMREYFKMVMVRLLKGEPKKRGPKPSPEILRKVKMLLEKPVFAVADILQSEYEEKQKQIYLSDGDTEAVAERLAMRDGEIFRREEMNRLRSLRSFYEIETQKKESRNLKKEKSAKKIDR